MAEFRHVSSKSSAASWSEMTHGSFFWRGALRIFPSGSFGFLLQQGRISVGAIWVRW